MDISLEVDLKEDPGKSGLTISRTVLFWGLHVYTHRCYKICTGQKSVEDPPSTQLGLPARGDPVFVAKGIKSSQVKVKVLYYVRNRLNHPTSALT